MNVDPNIMNKIIGIIFERVMSSIIFNKKI